MIITHTAEIPIGRPLVETFRFFANPANDPLWRAEINRTVADGPLRPGQRFSEYSKLSARQPNHEAIIRCVELRENARAVFESVKDARFYLKSVREVRPDAGGQCRAVYTIAFDTAVVRFALGFPLPAFLIRWKAKTDMKKYLSRLKVVLEAEAAGSEGR